MFTRYNRGWGNEPLIQSLFDDLRRRKEYQEKRDLPIRVIAEEADLSINTVQRFKSGDLDRFDRETLIKLCRYFAVKSISELIEYTPSE